MYKLQVSEATMIRTICIVLITLIIGLEGITSATAQSSEENVCAPSKLPRGVVQLLKRNYPSWKYEQVSDLHEEYQQMWIKQHPNDCPGFTAGRFKEAQATSYAVLLISGSGSTTSSKLVLISTTKAGAYNVALLFEEKTTQHYEVVSKMPPGSYSEPEEGKSVHLQLDGILLEALEVGSTLYYWRNGRFHSLVVSE